MSAGEGGGDPLARLAAGDLDGALALAEEGVRQRPADASAYNALGTVLARRGEVVAAERAFRAVIGLEPGAARGYSNLSSLLRSAHRLDEALAFILAAIERSPEAARLHARKGQLDRELERLEPAVDAFRRAFALEPSPAHRDLYARALFEAGHVAAALEIAAAAAPPTRDSVFIVASAHGALGHKQELEQALTRLLAMRPAPAMALQLTELTAFYNLRQLGLGLARAAREGSAPGDPLRDTALIVEAGHEETLQHLERALELFGQEIGAQRVPSERLFDAFLHTCDRHARRELFERVAEDALRRLPRSVRLRATVATHYLEIDRLDRALAVLEDARALAEDAPELHAVLASLHGTSGSFELARKHRGRALELTPLAEGTMRVGLFHDLHDDHVSPRALRDRQVAWADRFCVAKRTLDLAPRSLDPERRLRVAYLSGDFREHAVARFMLPLLEAHDRRAVELHLYSMSAMRDRVTDQIRALDLTFHDAAGLSPIAVARQIAEDGVDVLIELAGMTLPAALLVAAHRPAPVQVSYLGYPATTGVPEIDYRLTDAWADPVGLTDANCVEALARLPETGWCFRGEADLPVVERPEGGPLVLGSFNRATKLSDTALEAWARVLEALPEAVLLLKGRGLGNANVRERVRAIFAQRSVAATRVAMTGWAPGTREHLLSWGDVDIALDSYPYAGTTTTCEALWMGVPVVTLAGDSHVSRVGVSLLRQVGLDDLVARDWDEYVARVVALARDGARRRALRGQLRERMRASALGDGARFARDVEASVRAMWRAYVASPRASAPARSRLSRVEPRRFVPPSLAQRATFVAMEQGVERDAADALVRTALEAQAEVEAGARVVLCGGPASLAAALALHAACPKLHVELYEPEPEAAALAAASFERVGLPSARVFPRALAAAEAQGARLIDLPASSLAQLLEHGAPSAPLLLRFGSLEAWAEVEPLARGAGLELYLPLPARSALVPLSSSVEPCPLTRAVFALRPGQHLAPVVKPLDLEHPSVVAELRRARDAVELFERAGDASLALGLRAALLHAALARAEEEASADPVASQLTRARLSIELGRRAASARALEPLPELDASPRGRYLSPAGGPAREGPEPAGSARRQALEALVKWGARSSFDRPAAHRALLLDYFRAAGEDPELNRRLGLLVALHGVEEPS